MSTAQSHSHSLEGNAHGTTSSRKVAISSGIGATIEAYDFIGYGTAAALYFSTDFFPSGDPHIARNAVDEHMREAAQNLLNRNQVEPRSA